jgi:alpha-glucosidase (family GH31 glycosyl hydrolase)
MGLSGFPFWGNDLGGFPTKPSSRLHVRWAAQFGTFCPLFRVHGIAYSPRVGGREPWCYDLEAQEIFRKYDELRYLLIPYIYTYAHEACKAGLPIMRAMVLEYQNDENAMGKDLQYMFGEYILVAPVTREYLRVSDMSLIGKKEVYLPKGKWIDYWTHEIYEGPASINYTADLGTIPLFIKAGAIIPMAPRMSYVGEREVDPLLLDIYPLENNTFSLYEDDGTTLEYRENFFTTQAFDLRVMGDEMRIRIGICEGAYRGMPSQRRYILKVNCMPEKPSSITIENRELKEYENIDNVEEGWYYDFNRKITFIKTCPLPTGRAFEIKIY